MSQWIDAKVAYFDLCKALGIESIPGLVNGKGKALSRHSMISLTDVQVEDDDLQVVNCSRCERCEDEDDILPPPEACDLEDWLTALVAGDLSTARALTPRIFGDDRSLAICDRVLKRAPARRAA